MPPFDVITFDCYGTLVDWETGIAQAFERAARTDGVSIEPDAILRAYSLVEPVAEAAAYRSYREILADTTAEVARMLGWRLSYAAFLSESLPSWKPFPDTNPALERLRAAGIRLGILSNIDDDLLEATRKHFTVDFDIIVTAEQVRSYKPRLTHFVTARQRIGSNAGWLHAAQSNFHDIIPANQLGIATAWINRHGQAPLPGGTPTYHFSDLTQLADAMT
jgi:2-haloalkanoic acid dehalogenase type II